MDDLLANRGRRLWDSLTSQDPSLGEEANPLREVALSACRTADRLEELERIALGTEPIVEGRAGPVMHPVFVEVRQQAASLARLITALRLPDEATGKRPQQRTMRGAQRPSMPGGARVTAIEAARQKATGA